MAAGDNAERAGAASQRIEVKSDLDTHRPVSVVAIGVPTGVPGVEIAIAACVVKVITADAGGDVMDTRVIQYRTEVFTAIRNGKCKNDSPVVQCTMVSASVGSPDSFKLVDNLIRAVSQ